MRFRVWIASVDSPCVGPPSPSRSQCYDHRRYSGTHFLLLELHQAEMVSAVKYSYTSSITASCLASLFSNRSNCACSSPFVQILPLEIGKIGRKKPAIAFDVTPMAPHLDRMKIEHPPSP